MLPRIFSSRACRQIGKQCRRQLSAEAGTVSPYVYDVSDTTWQRLVVEESHQTPVILDAWAEFGNNFVDHRS